MDSSGGEPALFLVDHFQHAHDLVFCDQRDTHQCFYRIADGLFHIAEVTLILVRIVDAHRLAVGHNPARDAFIQRDNKAAHGGFVNIGGNLK
jgi:hypothetical protein